jgi:hypothetical protein
MMPGIPHPLVFTEASAVYLVSRAGFRVLSAYNVKTSDPHTEFLTIWAGK